jgi:hypothetical protein
VTDEVKKYEAVRELVDQLEVPNKLPVNPPRDITLPVILRVELEPLNMMLEPVICMLVPSSNIWLSPKVVAPTNLLILFVVPLPPTDPTAFKATEAVHAKEDVSA